MGETDRRRGMSCEQARELIHQVLDGDLMDAALRGELNTHLARCFQCRSAEAELHAIQSALRDLAPQSMSDAALDDVWTRTSRPQRHRFGRPSPRQWWAAAAAAVLAVTLYGAFQLNGSVNTEPTPEEIARATEQTRMVLGLTARALSDAKQAAFKDVLADEVSPALQRVPIRWPGRAGSERKESGDDV
jgi:anti-sigma factor RsiW